MRLLLDEHISIRVAHSIHSLNQRIEVLSITNWNGGSLKGASDLFVLRNAARENLTFVTYDRKTVPPILIARAAADESHGGIVFIDQKTIAPNDFGTLTRALIRLWVETQTWDWRNRIYFLSK